jgi:hypothetical protein
MSRIVICSLPSFIRISKQRKLCILLFVIVATWLVLRYIGAYIAFKTLDAENEQKIEPHDHSDLFPVKNSNKMSAESDLKHVSQNGIPKNPEYNLANKATASDLNEKNYMKSKENGSVKLKENYKNQNQTNTTNKPISKNETLGKNSIALAAKNGTNSTRDSTERKHMKFKGGMADLIAMRKNQKRKKPVSP